MRDDAALAVGQIGGFGDEYFRHSDPRFTPTYRETAGDCEAAAGARFFSRHSMSVPRMPFGM